MTKARKYPFGKAVQVRWYDSKSMFGWTYDDTLQRGCAKIQSIGYVVQTNKEGIVLTTSIGHSRASIDDITIPWGAIAEIQEIGKQWDREANSSGKESTTSGETSAGRS